MSDIVLTNGKVVKGKRSPVWLVLGVLLLLTVVFSFFVPINWATINLSQLGVILGKMFRPATNSDWGHYFAFMLTLGTPLLDTIKMSLAGTVIGALCALPLSVLSAQNIVKYKWIYMPIRFVLNLVRTIPAMVLAIVATFFVGYGLLSGIIAISIFSFGVTVKMYYETIETVDMSAFEALESNGANKAIAFRYAIWPQIAPVFLGYTIYVFEMNIRASAVLGFVGAGGIGQVISDNILYHYDRVGATILVLFAVVIVMQLLTNYLRRKLR